mmetsp:Transcript_54559/g.145697  ORF Transcript_54559/g.145697 Transcript_54559/m.145697 type:complete len:268 (-) Transcript_54559:73-876(-)
MRVSAVLFAVAAAQVADETKGYRNAWNDCGGKGASETMRMKTIAAKIKGWAKPLPFKRHSAQDCENGSDGVETANDGLVYPNPETFSKADAALEKAEKWTEQGLVPTVRPSLKGFKKTRTFETGAGAVGTKTGQKVVTGLLQEGEPEEEELDEGGHGEDEPEDEGEQEEEQDEDQGDDDNLDEDLTDTASTDGTDSVANATAGNTTDTEDATSSSTNILSGKGKTSKSAAAAELDEGGHGEDEPEDEGEQDDEEEEGEDEEGEEEQE